MRYQHKKIPNPKQESSTKWRCFVSFKVKIPIIFQRIVGKFCQPQPKIWKKMVGFRSPIFSIPILSTSILIYIPPPQPTKCCSLNEAVGIILEQGLPLLNNQRALSITPKVRHVAVILPKADRHAGWTTISPQIPQLFCNVFPLLLRPASTWNEKRKEFQLFLKSFTRECKCFFSFLAKLKKKMPNCANSCQIVQILA